MMASAGSMSSSPAPMATAAHRVGMQAMAAARAPRDTAPSVQPVWHCEQCADGPLPVYTAWVALGPVNASDGTLCFVPGSQKWKGFATPTPRTAQVPREFTERLRATKAGAARGKKLGKRKAGHESPLPEVAADQVQWHSADYRPGDLVIFNVKTVHAASKNQSNSYRLSLDTRFIVHAAGESNGHVTASSGAKGRRK